MTPGAGSHAPRLRGLPGGRATESATEFDDHVARAAERRLLIRELHDVVTHELSTIALQAMSQRDGSDPAQLRQAVQRIEAAAAGSLVELRLLERTLREDRAVVDAVRISDALRLVAPSSAAQVWQQRLRGDGFDAAIELAPGLDGLPTTTRRTLSRAIALSSDNIRRHAVAGSACTLSLTVHPAKVVLRVESLRGVGRPGPYGAELRGLRERVDLSGGSFRAAPSEDELTWVLEVALPCDGAGSSAAIVVLPGRAGP